jgi:hypothetical protein
VLPTRSTRASPADCIRAPADAWPRRDQTARLGLARQTGIRSRGGVSSWQAQGRREDGTLQVRTYREGLAQKVGHDLIIDVGQWEAAVQIGEDGTLSAVRLEADLRSLQVHGGLHGIKRLTDKDRADIRKTINEKILGERPIVFRSTAVEPGNGALTVHGELELAGTTRPARFELIAATDGGVRGTLPVTQSEWGSSPIEG